MGETIISDDGFYEWDELKDKENAKKHGFHFFEILEVFDDPIFLARYDNMHSTNEDRFHGIGCLNGIVVMLVCFTERERIRIISAMQADENIQEVYNDYVEKING